MDQEKEGRLDVGPSPTGGAWLAFDGKFVQLDREEARRLAVALLRYTGIDAHYEPARTVPNLIEGRI